MNLSNLKPAEGSTLLSCDLMEQLPLALLRLP